MGVPTGRPDCALGDRSQMFTPAARSAESRPSRCSDLFSLRPTLSIHPRYDRSRRDTVAQRPRSKCNGHFDFAVFRRTEISRRGNVLERVPRTLHARRTTPRWTPNDKLVHHGADGPGIRSSDLLPRRQRLSSPMSPRNVLQAMPSSALQPLLDESASWKTPPTASAGKRLARILSSRHDLPRRSHLHGTYLRQPLLHGNGLF